MVTDEDRQYLAGFFDGEGCIGIYANGRKTAYYLSVQWVQNENPESSILFDMIYHEWGGRVDRRTTGSGKIKLHYQVTGLKACRLLRDLSISDALKRLKI